MTVLWEWHLEGVIILFWPSHKATGFYHDYWMLVFKVNVELGKEVMGIEQGKIQQISLQISLFWLIFSYFSWIKDKSPSDCCNPLVNFQNSEKVYSDNFCQYFHCFYRGEGFQSSLLCYFSLSPQWPLLIINNFNILYCLRMKFFNDITYQYT